MKFLLDFGWESLAIYRIIPGEASLSEEEDDPLESTSCFLYCLLFCTPALSGESSDPLLLSPSYNTFNIYTFCIQTGNVIFKKGVKLSFIYIKQWNIIFDLELCVNSCPQVYCESTCNWQQLICVLLPWPRPSVWRVKLTLNCLNCWTTQSCQGHFIQLINTYSIQLQTPLSFHTGNNGGINCLTVTDRSYI